MTEAPFSMAGATSTRDQASEATELRLVVRGRTSTGAFVDSMPSAYRLLFDRATMATHAAIVQRRGRATVHMEPWKQLSGGVVAICVAADDVADLVSRICAAVFTHGADVVGAQTYSRTRDDFVREAVALVWIRKAPDANRSTDPLEAHDVDRIAQTLGLLLRGYPDIPSTARLVRAVRAAGRATVVELDEALRGGTMLTVEVDDRPGLLARIKRALVHEGVQIRSSHLQSGGRREVGRFWVTERDGRPLRGQRQLEVRVAVLEAMGDPPERRLKGETTRAERAGRAPTRTH